MNTLAATLPFPAEAEAHHPARRRWIAAGLLLLALVIGLTWRAWVVGGEEQALQAMKPGVKLASVYVTRILEYQSARSKASASAS